MTRKMSLTRMITCEIPSTETKLMSGERGALERLQLKAKAYTVYKIRTSQGSAQTTIEVERRFSEFLDLDSRVRCFDVFVL